MYACPHLWLTKKTKGGMGSVLMILFRPELLLIQALFTYNITKTVTLLFIIFPNIRIEHLGSRGYHISLLCRLSLVRFKHIIKPKRNKRYSIYKIQIHAFIQVKQLKGPIPSILLLLFYTINQKPMIPRTDFHFITTWVARFSG